MKKFNDDEIESLIIYVRTENLFYIKIDNNINYYDGVYFDDLLKLILQENPEINKKTKVSVIYHYNFADILHTRKKIDLNKFGSYVRKNIYLSHIDDVKLSIYFPKKEINYVRKQLSKYKFKLDCIKLDFCSLINFYMQKNEEEKEILQLGEDYSIRFKIDYKKIIEVEKLDLTIGDFKENPDYDFSDIELISDDDKSLQYIFEGAEIYSNYNFFNNKSNVISTKRIIFDLILLSMIIFGFFYEYNKLNLENISKEINKYEILYEEYENKISDLPVLETDLYHYESLFFDEMSEIYKKEANDSKLFDVLLFLNSNLRSEYYEDCALPDEYYFYEEYFDINEEYLDYIEYDLVCTQLNINELIYEKGKWRITLTGHNFRNMIDMFVPLFEEEFNNVNVLKNFRTSNVDLIDEIELEFYY